MNKLQLRTAVAAGAVAPLLLVSAGSASAADELTVNAFQIPIIGITVVQVSGAMPNSVCFASHEPLDADAIKGDAGDIVRDFPRNTLNLLPNGTSGDPQGNATIMLATTRATPPFDVHALCTKPVILPMTSHNIRTGNAVVSSGFGS